jgi:hypothetical protein
MQCWKLPWTKNVGGELTPSEMLSKTSVELLKPRNSLLKCVKSCPFLRKRHVGHGRNWDDANKRSAIEHCLSSQDNQLLSAASKLSL